MNYTEIVAHTPEAKALLDEIENEPVCRNCVFWQLTKAEFGHCINSDASLETLHDGFAFPTLDDFGCIHFRIGAVEDE